MASVHVLVIQACVELMSEMIRVGMYSLAVCNMYRVSFSVAVSGLWLKKSFQSVAVKCLFSSVHLAFE